MEGYRLLQRLGKGAQGTVHLAEARKDGSKCVLKKVECKDESEANKAFSEAMILMELQHPYICGYKEFFVMWDNELSAMFVCIVMEYYSKGDLSQTLRKQRELHKPLEEQLVKKWLGQTLEALIFCHKRKVVHRDLKPSNIFMQEDDSIIVGDFGVCTIMEDIRCRTRSTVGSMNWMAPEVLDHEYDERSDVWSLGCIILEMMTCHLLDTSQITGKLLEIKHNPQALLDILETTKDTYSEILISTVKLMLKRNYEHRPSTIKLMSLGFIQECLALSGSVLTERRKRQQAPASGGTLSSEQGLNRLIDFIQENVTNEECVRDTLPKIEELTKHDGVTLDGSSKRVLLRAMQEHEPNADVQLSCCNIFNHLVITAVEYDVLYSTEVVSSIIKAMKSHKKVVDIQISAISLISALSATFQSAADIGSEGGMHCIMTAMRTFTDNARLSSVGCLALWGLLVNEENSRIATEESVIYDVVKAMKNHLSDTNLNENACTAILGLAMEDENLEILTKKIDGVGLLMMTLKNHASHAKVIKNACLALASLIEPEEENAYRVLTSNQDGTEMEGLPVIYDVYCNHRDNAEVIESICTVLMELAEYDEIRAEMVFLRLNDQILGEVQKRFKDNQDVIKPCDAALAKLKNTKAH